MPEKKSMKQKIKTAEKKAKSSGVIMPSDEYQYLLDMIKTPKKKGMK